MSPLLKKNIIIFTRKQRSNMTGQRVVQIRSKKYSWGGYVWGAEISLDRVYLLFAVQLKKMGMYEGHLRLFGRQKRVLSFSLIFVRVGRIKMAAQSYKCSTDVNAEKGPKI